MLIFRFAATSNIKYNTKQCMKKFILIHWLSIDFTEDKRRWSIMVNLNWFGSIIVSMGINRKVLNWMANPVEPWWPKMLTKSGSKNIFCTPRHLKHGCMIIRPFIFSWMYKSLKNIFRQSDEEHEHGLQWICHEKLISKNLTS